MKHFFAPAYFQENALAPYTYLGTDEQKALDTFDKLKKECPYDFYYYDEEDKSLYAFTFEHNEWTRCCRMWFVVRDNPGFNYPETVISEDAIFDTLAKAEAYIKEHGGSWKMYDFKGLQCKMAESLRLMDELNRQRQEADVELPF